MGKWGLGQPKDPEKVQTRGKWEGRASPGSVGDQLCDLRVTTTPVSPPLLTHPWRSVSRDCSNQSCLHVQRLMSGSTRMEAGGVRAG